MHSRRSSIPSSSKGLCSTTRNSQRPGAFARLIPVTSLPFWARDGKHVIIYHLLTQGRARGEVEGSGHGVDLGPGDIVVFPHGDPHVVSNGSPVCIVDNGKLLKEVFAQGLALARGGGGGESTLFVCGYMDCDQGTLQNLSRRAAPGVQGEHPQRRGGAMAGKLDQVFRQASGENHAGSDAVLARLSEALFVETLRRYMADLPETQTGWLAGARDPAATYAGASWNL